jgi:ElaA protein
VSVAGAMEWLSWSDLSPELLYEVLRFRQDIFVVEQNCAYPELDGRDQVGRHLLLRIGGAVAGYLRLIPDAGNQQVRIGRVAVAAAHRRRGLARRLMAEALARCRADYPGYALGLSAQAHLVPFYAGFGFTPVSPPYDDEGIPHVDMVNA